MYQSNRQACSSSGCPATGETKWDRLPGLATGRRRGRSRVASKATMTLTAEIHPAVQAELIRRAAAQCRPVEGYAAILLEEAAQAIKTQLD